MRILAALILLHCSSPALACWDVVAQKYSVDPALLRAIAEQESGFNNHAINRNANGSRDVCMMQVNSAWFPTLQNRFQISERDLTNNWCTCLEVGAWILAQGCIRGMSWDCVGAYNATSSSKRSAYAWRIYRRLHPQEQSNRSLAQVHHRPENERNVTPVAATGTAHAQSLVAFEQ